MTDKQVAEQIEALKRVGAKARESKEATIDFLKRAGILELLPDYERGKSVTSTSDTKTEAK